MTEQGVPRHRIYHIDGIRGILAMLVACSHFYGSITGYASDRPLVGAALAVDFFFLLSGYVLTHQLLIKPCKYSHHIANRVWRLLPLHVLTIFLTLGAVWVNNHIGGYVPSWYAHMSSELLLSNLMMLTHTGLTEIPVINAPAWSISVEFIVSAFILYPFVRHHQKWLATGIALIVACVIGTFWEWNLRAEQNIAPMVNGGLLRALQGILLGYSIYWWSDRTQYSISRLVEWAAPVLLVYCFLRIIDNRPEQDFLALIAFGLVIFGWHRDSESITRRLLSAKPLTYLGSISFSAYLLHTPLLLLIPPGRLATITGPETAVVILLFITIALSTACYYGFEKRTQRFIKNTIFRDK